MPPCIRSNVGVWPINVNGTEGWQSCRAQPSWRCILPPASLNMDPNTSPFCSPIEYFPEVMTISSWVEQMQSGRGRLGLGVADTTAHGSRQGIQRLG